MKDPKENKEAASGIEQDLICPGCGMEQKDWNENQGQGHQQGQELYCCRGCAEGTGCTCGDDSAVD